MNIVMNNPQVQLSPELQKFKDATQDLSFPLRGQALDSNESIRTVHNSLARRIDLLNSDLWISQKDATYQKAKKRKAPAANGKKKATTKSAGKRRTKKPKVSSDAAFHYIAYVAVKGALWELDGLKPRPINLGPLEEGQDLLSAAQGFIEARCAMYGAEALHFNVMGLCQSPLATASAALARSIRHFELLHEQRAGNAHFASLTDGTEQALTIEDVGKLKEYDLTPEQVRATEPDADFAAKVADRNLLPVQLMDMFQELVTEQKATMGEYRAEKSALAENELRVQGRRQDSMPMIHRWLQALADQEKLEELMSG